MKLQGYDQALIDGREKQYKNNDGNMVQNKLFTVVLRQLESVSDNKWLPGVDNQLLRRGFHNKKNKDIYWCEGLSGLTIYFQMRCFHFIG